MASELSVQNSYFDKCKSSFMYIVRVLKKMPSSIKRNMIILCKVPFYVNVEVFFFFFLQRLG